MHLHKIVNNTNSQTYVQNLIVSSTYKNMEEVLYSNFKFYPKHFGSKFHSWNNIGIPVRFSKKV